MPDPLAELRIDKRRAREPGRGRAARGALRAVLTGICLLAGCGEEEGLDGTWTGGVLDSRAGNGGVTLRLSQSGSDLGGTWEILFSAASPFNDTGTLTGTVQGAAISADLASGGTCVLALTASRSGETLRGEYTAVACGTQRTGQVDLTRR
jgi:hypothetical protein